jgi:hypothetical protein
MHMELFHLQVSYEIFSWKFEILNFNFRNPEHFIIHFTSSQEIRLTWEEIMDVGFGLVRNELPLNQILWCKILSKFHL